MIRVLVPSFSDDLLHAFLASLEASERGSASRVVVGDNGLSPAFRQAWPAPTYVPVPTPFVHAQAINACARAHPSDDMLICGDDTAMLTPGWFTVVEDFMGRWPGDYGAVNLNGAAPLEESPTAQGFSMTLIPRWVWDRVGALDERYVGYGFEDFDFCVRLWHAGLKVGTSDVVALKHEGTVGSIRRLGSYEAVIRSCYLSYDLFYAKWGLPVPPDRAITFIPAAGHLNRHGCACREEAAPR